MSTPAVFQLTIEGVAVALDVVRVRAEERVHAPSHYRVSVTASDFDAVDLDALIGAAAELSWASSGGPMVVFGAIDEAHAAHGGFELTIMPRAALLQHAVDHRVFVDRDAVEIAREVLADQSIDLEVRVARVLTKRAQCVQAFESDLGFVARILAEEGIRYTFEHTTGRDVIVLSDSESGAPELVGGAELPWVDERGLVGGEGVFDAEIGHALVTGKVFLRDFDFERPSLDQNVDRVGAGPAALERYEYPGGYRDPSLGNALAELRLGEARATQVTLRARSSCRRLAAGSVFSLAGAPRDGMDGRWLIVELTWRATDGNARPGDAATRWEAELVAVRADAAYRPRRTRAPRVGVQTATTTGPSGAEIHTDARGRIKALHRWDRRRAEDDTSSTWMRVVQPPTSGGLFVPRVGWEVVLCFQGASCDEPHELGRLYTGEDVPPEGLPGHKVRGAFGTRTTPGGGSCNLVRMDDSAGGEQFTMNASHDYNERTEGKKKTSVVASDTVEVGADQKVIVGLDHTVLVEGAQSYSIGADRQLNGFAGIVIEAGSESVSAGSRFFQVGGDFSTKVGGDLFRAVGGAKAVVAIAAYNRHVTEASLVAVAGTWAETGALAGVSVGGLSGLLCAAMNVMASKYSVTGSSLLDVSGPRTVLTGGHYKEQAGGALSLSLGDARIQGVDVKFSASGSIKLAAGGAEILIDKSSVTFNGAFSASDVAVASGAVEYA